jgi:heme A synthase
MGMKSWRYLMIFQVLLGIWLMVSPFALGYRQLMRVTLNDLVLGFIVALLGLIMAFIAFPPDSKGEGNGRNSLPF